MHSDLPLTLALLAALLTAALVVLIVLALRGRAALMRDKQLAEQRAHRYRGLFESPLAGIALVAADGRLLEWNEKLLTILGVASDDPGIIREQSWQEQVVSLWRLSRQYPAGEQHETSFLAADGTRCWVTLRHSPMPDGVSNATGSLPGDAGSRGDTDCYWLLIQDVTRRREARTLLRLAEQIYRGMSEAILITDATTRIIEVNPAFERISGYGRAEVLGMRSSLVRSGRHDAAFFDAMWRKLTASGHWSGEIWNRRRDGSEIPCWMHIDAVRDPKSREITHFVGVFSDISERKLIEDKISFLAHHDPLTGLANRFALDAVLPQSIAVARRNGQRVALLFTDLDHFKTVNDTLGHSAGDQVLIEAGRRMAHVIRESDFLARIGGDEFVMLLNEIRDADDALRVAVAVREALRRPIVAGGIEVVVTPSIGISLFPEDGDDATLLLDRADNAMYRVKADGRDGCRFNSPA